MLEGEDDIRYIDIKVDTDFKVKNKKKVKGTNYLNNSIRQMVESLDALKKGESYMFFPERTTMTIELFYMKMKYWYKLRTGKPFHKDGLRAHIATDRDCVIIVRV